MLSCSKKFKYKNIRNKRSSSTNLHLLIYIFVFCVPLCLFQKFDEIKYFQNSKGNNVNDNVKLSSP